MKNDTFDIEYMDITSKEDTKIRFTANGGYDHERDDSKKILSLNSIYTVFHIAIFEWSSYVVLKEFPNERFNTALFEKVK